MQSCFDKSMLFYWLDRSGGKWQPPNEAWRFAMWWRWLMLLLCGAGGLLYAVALPPLNIGAAAFFTLVPVLIFISLERRWYWNALAGWFWGWCWAVCAYRFLREIEWFVPWLLAPVMGLFPALWAVLTAQASRAIMFDPGVDAIGMDDRRHYLENGPWPLRSLMLGISAAALFTAVEYARSRLFVWNDLAVTQYRNLPLIQLAALTGSYGVGFAVALVNTAVWMLAFRRGWRASLMLLGIAALLFGSGILYSGHRAKTVGQGMEWKVLAVQGDLSQRRRATMAQTAEAIDTYEQLTLEALKSHPDADIVMWSESSIPIIYYSAWDLLALRPNAANAVYIRYQQTVRRICSTHRKRLLFGALDMAEKPPWMRKDVGVTNSALLTDEQGLVQARYDKFHRVPFGEYVPGRKFLPESWAKAFDMGRDLTPGDRLFAFSLPLDRAGDPHTVRPGVAICYEGVFGYLTRRLMLSGANVLVVLSNDAWYPRSSEPEQHLANATLRAVECGVPMVRVGNNGGTGIVMPDGRFTQALEVPGTETRPELRRGRGFRMLKVPVEEFPRKTFYIRFGEWFPMLLMALSAAVTIYALIREHSILEVLDRSEKMN